MKYYHSADRFIRQRIRNHQLGLFYVILFLILWLVLEVVMVYANIFYLSIGVNLYLPLYFSVYITLLLCFRIQYRFVPSIVDAVVLRRLFRIQFFLLIIMALLIIPIHISIMNGYASHGEEIPLRILLFEGVGYTLFVALSLLQCTVVYFSEKWNTSSELIDVENT